MDMTAIVAVDQNWGIGYQNQLLFRIPADQKFFRETTTGGVVVMGRKTLFSFPKQAPLPNRTNLVLTRDPSFQREGVTVIHGREELMELLKGYEREKVFLIGGEQVYREFLDLCNSALVTKIHASRPADAFFPNLDDRKDWCFKEESDAGSFEDVSFSFCRYERNTNATTPKP